MLFAVALGAGCEAIFHFDKVPEGSTSGATEGSGGTASSGTQCSAASDCIGERPCVEVACQAGTCAYSNKPAAAPVSNESPTDCLQKVCDGQGNVTSVPDDSEVPDTPGDTCHHYLCENGAPAPHPINEGQPCSDPAHPCKAGTCGGGQCIMEMNVSDGTIVAKGNAASCNDTVCMSGQAVSQPDSNNCPDADPNDCQIPICNSGSCGTMLAAFFSDCKRKSNGEPGKCNGFGDCCSPGGSCN